MNEMMDPITIAVMTVIFGGISIFCSPRYGEKYSLYLTIKSAIPVIRMVETIHQTINKMPSESALCIPRKRSEIFPVNGMDRMDVAIPTTI